MKINSKVKTNLKTAEEAPAKRITPLQQLKRSVMSCMLWEDQFYEDGVTIADRVVELMKQVSVRDLADLILDAKFNMKLRHMPLFLTVNMLKLHNNRNQHDVDMSEIVDKVIVRADELAEILALYWKDGKCPLSNQFKKGLAKAFTKFDEYQLGKWG